MTTPNKLVDESSVVSRLIKLITKISEGEQYALLDELKERYPRLKRKHYRKPIRTNIEYITRYRSENSHIQNISAGGVFIETRMPFRIGEEISLNFLLPTETQEQITINGQIVRVTPDGVGVAFKTLSEEQKLQVKSYMEML